MILFSNCGQFLQNYISYLFNFIYAVLIRPIFETDLVKYNLLKTLNFTGYNRDEIISYIPTVRVCTCSPKNVYLCPQAVTCAQISCLICLLQSISAFEEHRMCSSEMTNAVMNMNYYYNSNRCPHLRRTVFLQLTGSSFLEFSISSSSGPNLYNLVWIQFLTSSPKSFLLLKAFAIKY